MATGLVIFATPPQRAGAYRTKDAAEAESLRTRVSPERVLERFRRAWGAGP